MIEVIMSEEIVNKNNNDVLKQTIVVKDDPFNHIMVPTLQNISMVCIVTTIYKQKDVREMIQQEGNEEETLTETQQHLQQKLSHLKIPNSLKSKALDVCKVVAFQGNYALSLMSLSDERCRCGYYFFIPREYFDCLLFKMDGTVDRIKTIRLMNEKGYPSYKVFVAASHLCLSDLAFQSWYKIASNFPQNTSELEILNHLHITHYEDSDCPMTKYWAFSATNKLSDLANGIIIEGNFQSGINVNMFEFVFDYNNSHAVKYFYPILPDGEKQNIMNLYKAFREAYNNYVFLKWEDADYFNIFFFLLSNVSDGEKQIQILKPRFDLLIQPLVKNLLYQKYLQPLTQLVWNSLDENDFHLIFTKLFGMVGGGNIVAWNSFKDVWSLCSASVRMSFFHKFITHLCHEFNGCYILENEFSDIVKLILSEGPDEGKGKCLVSLVNLGKLNNSTLKDVGYLNVIDTFLGKVLTSQVEISIFKKHVLDFFHEQLIINWLSHWILLDDYDSVEKFLSWAFNSNENEIDHFKRNSINLNLIIKAIKREFGDYEKVEKFLNWVFTSQNEIDDCKRNFGNSELMRTLIMDSKISVGQYESAEKFISWCFNNSEAEIKEFKKAFGYKSHSFYFQNWELYVKFVEWCFENEVDVEYYKKMMSKFKKLSDIALSRITNNDFEYINNLLNWCLSPEKVRQFKMKLFDSTYRLRILQQIACERKTAEFRGLEYPSTRVMGKKLSEWYGSIGSERIRKMKNMMYRRKKKEYDRRYLYRTSPSILLTIFKEFVKSLQSHHKLTLKP